VLAPDLVVLDRGEGGCEVRGDAGLECGLYLGDTGEAGSKMARDCPMLWFGCNAWGDVAVVVAIFPQEFVL
jgi:hypothetical protein